MKKMNSVFYRFINNYLPFGIIEWSVLFQYNIWFWVQMLRDLMAMVIMTAFWQGIYTNQSELSGIGLTTTLSYVILARSLGNANNSSVFWWLASRIRAGDIAHDLLRPVDVQLMHLVRDGCGWLLGLIRQAPVIVLGVVVFGAQLPIDPLVYLAFLITFFLGGAVLFFLEFMLGCLGFYTTEVWGLSVLRNGVALFFSGALIPLDLLPDSLQNIAKLTPFAQALYMPVSLLSGVQPLGALGSIVMTQVISIVTLMAISRLMFRYSLRTLTIQGG
jgi:ABC-2 type transport system permease protein